MYSEKETLTDENQFNEYMMTNLRTMWGIDLIYLQSVYPKNWESVSSKLQRYDSKGLALREGNRWRLTEAAWLISDDIFVELFM